MNIVNDETSADDGATATGMADRARARIPDLVALPDPDDPDTVYERTAASAWRLIGALLGIVVVELAAEALPRAQRGLELDLQGEVGGLGTDLGRLADAVATGWAALVLVVSIVVAATTRRPRLLLTAAGAAAVAGGLVAVAASNAGTTPNALTAGEWKFVVIAAAVAMGAVTSSVFVAPIARWSTGVIAAFTLLGVLGDEISLPSRVILVLAGEAVGATMALAAGTPSRRVTRPVVLAALARARLPVERLERHRGDARGSQPWTGNLSTGRDVFVKVEATDELRAAQLFRMWRRIRLKRSGDGRAPSTVRGSAEHEAFVAGRAQVAGVRTPSVLAIAVLPDERGVATVFESVAGDTFDDVDDLSDAALRSAWAQVQVLRRAGIAHRDLRAANLMCVDDDAWIIDFGFAEVAATDELLDRDIAELLASTAALVGPVRAVDQAVAVLGPDTVADAIPWVQPLAVAEATRRSLDKERFAELRELVRARAGRSAPELPQMQRITPKGVAITVALGVAVWTLLPQLTSGVDWGAALEANPVLIVAAVMASVLTYVGAAFSVAGSVPDSLPLGPTFLAQLAGSFVNRVTPAKVGSLALNLRFLTQQGVDGAAATTGLAVSTAAGTVVHVLTTLVVVLWAGNVGFPGLATPPGWVWPVVAAVVVITIVAIAVVPPLRAWWDDTALPSARRSARSFVQVMRSPRNLGMLLGGSALVTVGNLVAFVVSARAFDIDVSLASLGVVYLAGSALASVAPTPGGLGATEAALVAGLAVVEVTRNEAIPAVLLFRLATFWLPILPGWLALIYLQRRKVL